MEGVLKWVAREGATESRSMTRRRFVRSGLGAMASPVLAGCLRQPTGPSEARDEDPRLTARPHAPSKTPIVGESELGLRAFADGLLYVPDSYDPAEPAPLLVALHGAMGRARDWRGFYPACEERGMILLAVDSRSNTWGDPYSGYFGQDVGFIDSALELVFDHCVIDPGRIALAGFSDGASYALSLGPSNGDLFGHLIAFSPGFSAPGDVVVGLPRIFVSHGSEDTVLSAERTRLVIVPELEAAGYDVTYLEFRGGHEVPADVAVAGLDWFLSVES